MTSAPDSWTKDTALIVVAALLFLAWRGYPYVLLAAFVVVLSLLIYPSLWKPVAWAWFNATRGIGLVAQRIVFSLIFFLVIWPVGYLRRLLRPETVALWRGAVRERSVFVVREHHYALNDFQYPY